MKKLIVAAVAATRKIAKMVLIIRVFIEKSTLFCKKNTKKYFFTTKSKNNDFLACV
jgi:hypothetical protein